jgi:WD40 repeat protein
VKEQHVFEAHGSYVVDLCFTQDSQTLLSAGMDNVVRLWLAPEWKLWRTIEGHANSVNSIALSPDEQMLVTGSTDQSVRVWSLPDGGLLQTLRDRKKTVANVEISADGKWIAAGWYGGRATVWTMGGEQVVSLKASEANLSSVAFSPDATILATAGLGDDISLWSLPSGGPIGVLRGHSTAVASLSFVDGGRNLVSLGYEQGIRFWDTKTWRESRVVRADRGGVRGIAFSPNEKLAALSVESQVQLWWVEDWRLAATVPVSTRVVSSLVFSPDGQLLAIGGADKRIRILEIGSL